MKQNILGESPTACRKRLIRKVILCAAAAIFTVTVNLMLTALRTPENHNLFLFINILSDIGLGWFLLFFISTRIIPQYGLYRLTQRESAKISATVAQIAPETVRYMNLDCRKITADGHIFFLPENTVKLQIGRLYTFRLVSNTVVEVEE